MLYFKAITSLFFLLFVFSCSEEKEPKLPVKWTTEESIEMNSTFSEEEEASIDAYLKRRPDWKMSKTGTGLQYFIYQKRDNNDSVKIGDVVSVEFSVELLDGTVCYESNAGESESFMVEKSDLETGLHEGIKKMKLNERGKFILPSHLAHGLLGDRDKIPPMETVIYDIKLINITSQ